MEGDHGCRSKRCGCRYFLGISKMNRAGLYANILAKQERIKAGSGERMKRPGEAGRPTAADFKQAAKTAKPENKR